MTGPGPRSRTVRAARVLAVVLVLLVVAVAAYGALSRRPAEMPDGTPGVPGWPLETEGAGVDAPTASDAFAWGRPAWADEFGEPDQETAPTPPDPVWALYNSAGHDGNGLRRPSQATVGGGVLTQTGTADALSAGMVRRAGESRFGRWEVRLRADQQGQGARPYHAVVALIPTSVPYAAGERDVDFMEADVGSGQAYLFLHSPPNQQDYLSVPVDLGQWHTFAVEIAPTHVAWFVDGVPRATVTRPQAIPTTPLALNVQLDAFRPDGLVPGRIQIDWARYYALPAGSPVRPPAAPTPASGGYDPNG